MTGNKGKIHAITALSNLLVFDLDGVITSEEAYWDAAGLTLHELMYSPRYWETDISHLHADREYHPVATAGESRRISRAILPEAEILALKARAINSNWDICYAVACLHLIGLLASLPDISALLPLRPWNAEWLAAFRKYQKDPDASVPPQGERLHLDLFDIFPFKGYVGLALINRFDVYASEVLGHPMENVFSRYSPFWTFCQDIFQEWYLGDDLYTQTYGQPPAQTGKPGCIHFEHPLLPLEEMRATLETLKRQGYVLGFATGRVYQEAIYPLKMYGLLRYFDEQHIATYDYVERAEAQLRAHGDATLLGKPHPFQFLVALDHNNQNAWQQRNIGMQGESMVGGVGIAGKAGVAAEGDRIGGVSMAGASPATTNHDSPQFDRQTVVAGLAPAMPLSPAITPTALQTPPFIVIGDSTSDILGGRAAGALTVAVLTGARTPEARRLLAQSDPDFTIENITKLPELLAYIDSLTTIQRLQFSAREKAERLLRRWFARHMHLQVDNVTLSPKAVSLNSFNGVYRLKSNEYFFKTHVEEQGILEEYYHAEMLHQAGYNIVRPLQTLHEEGRQMVVYPLVDWPVMFDLARAVEIGGAGDSTFETLVTAEKRECERLLSIYEATLTQSTAEEHARAPIHQLFWHRLAGGRLKSFYERKLVPFLSTRDSQNAETDIFFEELLKCRWTINGDQQPQTLGELIERARTVLNPAREAMTISGHGDAHFGNVFLENQKDYLYFDPAFAGRHSPLLDIIKPLYHNVFASWMYFPDEVAEQLELSIALRGTNIYVEHNFDLTPLRRALRATKLEYLLKPVLAMLDARGALSADWMEIVRLALMCCPLLTINLLDEERIPAVISWLGLSHVIAMGHLSMPGGIEL